MIFRVKAILFHEKVLSTDSAGNVFCAQVGGNIWGTTFVTHVGAIYDLKPIYRPSANVWEWVDAKDEIAYFTENEVEQVVYDDFDKL